jgi:glyoxylase-like metal-dependent hydrolase (beta-lactamase superfamily II)
MTYYANVLKFNFFSLGYGVTAVTAPMGEKIYVIEGDKYALVIDTGMGIGSLKGCIRQFCSLPLVVVNTHGHPDHCGGNAEFDSCYLNFKDYDLYYKMVSYEFRAGDIYKILGNDGKVYKDGLLQFSENILPLKDGDAFDLGGRTVTIYPLAGHTAGSVVLYDDKTKWLFVGDAVSIKDTWVYLDYSTTVEEYKNALEAFMKNNLKIEKIFSGHEPNIASSELLAIRLECLNGLLSGSLRGEYVHTFAGDGMRIEYKGTSLIYNKERLKL